MTTRGSGWAARRGGGLVAEVRAGIEGGSGPEETGREDTREMCSAPHIGGTVEELQVVRASVVGCLSALSGMAPQRERGGLELRHRL